MTILRSLGTVRSLYRLIGRFTPSEQSNVAHGRRLNIPRTVKLPELPEIEHLKRTLVPILAGAKIRSVSLERPDIVRSARPALHNVTSRALLGGQTVSQLDRRGKQLAILTDGGPALCIHLGMSGQLRFSPQGTRFQQTDHVHCRWRLQGPAGRGTLLFRDPRRFGGIWAFDRAEDLAQRWARLGPDALTIRAGALANQLQASRRPIKAALLDQDRIAGIGNIYADEALFTAAIHPLTPCCVLTRDDFRALADSIRVTLRQAVEAGGSTLRDYADANGQNGWFAVQHRVYGRAGLPCERCSRPLDRLTVAQRTTVACARCQLIRR